MNSTTKANWISKEKKRGARMPFAFNVCDKCSAQSTCVSWGRLVNKWVLCNNKHVYFVILFNKKTKTIVPKGNNQEFVSLAFHTVWHFVTMHTVIKLTVLYTYIWPVNLVILQRIHFTQWPYQAKMTRKQWVYSNCVQYKVQSISSIICLKREHFIFTNTCYVNLTKLIAIKNKVWENKDSLLI